MLFFDTEYEWFRRMRYNVIRVSRILFVDRNHADTCETRHHSDLAVSIECRTLYFIVFAPPKNRKTVTTTTTTVVPFFPRYARSRVVRLRFPRERLKWYYFICLPLIPRELEDIARNVNIRVLADGRVRSVLFRFVAGWATRKD